MSLKDRFANHSENAAEQPQPEEQKSVELYDTAGHARNICFVQTNGEKCFLNYVDLISGSFSPEKNSIELSFTSNTVLIHGTNLSLLYNQIRSQEVKELKVSDSRYSEIAPENDTLIKEIVFSRM